MQHVLMIRIQDAGARQLDQREPFLGPTERPEQSVQGLCSLGSMANDEIRNPVGRVGPTAAAGRDTRAHSVSFLLGRLHEHKSPCCRCDHGRRCSRLSGARGEEPAGLCTAWHSPAGGAHRIAELAVDAEPDTARQRRSGEQARLGPKYGAADRQMCPGDWSAGLKRRECPHWRPAA
jgi:hypothetical protein